MRKRGFVVVVAPEQNTSGLVDGDGEGWIAGSIGIYIGIRGWRLGQEEDEVRMRCPRGVVEEVWSLEVGQ